MYFSSLHVNKYNLKIKLEYFVCDTDDEISH